MRAVPRRRRVAVSVPAARHTTSRAAPTSTLFITCETRGARTLGPGLQAPEHGRRVFSALLQAISGKRRPPRVLDPALLRATPPCSLLQT